MRSQWCRATVFQVGAVSPSGGVAPRRHRSRRIATDVRRHQMPVHLRRRPLDKCELSRSPRPAAGRASTPCRAPPRLRRFRPVPPAAAERPRGLLDLLTDQDSRPHKRPRESRSGQTRQHHRLEPAGHRLRSRHHSQRTHQLSLVSPPGCAPRGRGLHDVVHRGEPSRGGRRDSPPPPQRARLFECSPTPPGQPASTRSRRTHAKTQHRIRNLHTLPRGPPIAPLTW